jgi:uncharacterized membrane protein YhaH (DUF805 family)
LLFFQTYMDVFKYSGRSSRAEFWLFLALTLILVLPIVMILQIGLGVPEWGVLVLSLWPSLAQLSLYVRRIRDIGISAWWGLLLIPIGLPMLFVGFIPSSKKVTHQSHTIRHSNEDKILDLEQIANEEFLYEKAFSELHSDKRRTGLWAKAVSSSSGDEKLAESLYIKYRVQLLINEQQLDKTEKKNDSPQAIKIKENENISDVDMQAEGEQKQKHHNQRTYNPTLAKLFSEENRHWAKFFCYASYLLILTIFVGYAFIYPIVFYVNDASAISNFIMWENLQNQKNNYHILFIFSCLTSVLAALAYLFYINRFVYTKYVCFVFFSSMFVVFVLMRNLANDLKHAHHKVDYSDVDLIVDFINFELFLFAENIYMKICMVLLLSSMPLVSILFFRMIDDNGRVFNNEVTLDKTFGYLIPAIGYSIILIYRAFF